MIATKNLMSWMLVATVFAGTATACSSDAKKPATTAAPAATTAGGGGGASANPDVAAFCTSADELAAEFKKVMADPASGDVTGLTAKATDLSAKAATLTSASPADAAAISACLQKMSTAMTGG
jgi:hypothetical protein